LAEQAAADPAMSLEDITRIDGSASRARVTLARVIEARRKNGSPVTDEPSAFASNVGDEVTAKVAELHRQRGTNGS
jgi:hypothetical protein